MKLQRPKSAGEIAFCVLRDKTVRVERTVLHQRAARRAALKSLAGRETALKVAQMHRCSFR